MSSRSIRRSTGYVLVMALFMLTWLILISATLAQEIALGLRINNYAGQNISYQQAAEEALLEGLGHLNNLASFTRPAAATTFVRAQGVLIYNSDSMDYVHTLEPRLWHRSASGAGGYLLEYVAALPLSAAEIARLASQAAGAAAFMFRVTAYAAGPSGQPVAVLQSSQRKVFFADGAPEATPALQLVFRSLPASML